MTTREWPKQPVQVEWNLDGRGMILKGQDLLFIDKLGYRWIAKVGDELDGASIPRFFWRVAGSPYCGKYREASIVHDVYCMNKVIDSRLVHNAFHEMMIASGCSKWKAWCMWAAVRMFGPRFKNNRLRIF
jgi:hypothetical protein